MKSVIILFITFVISNAALAGRGVVIREDVCGLGNSIIETIDGWYVVSEHWSGVYLYEGDIVYGNMKTYGFETLRVFI